MSRKIATLVGTGIIGGGGTPAPTVTRLLDDQFTDTVAAGSVNGTTATPGGQTRGAVDTASHLSVTGGRKRFNSYASQGNDPRSYYGPFTRAQGLAFSFDFFVNSLSFIDAFIWGWMTGTGTGTARWIHSLYFHSTSGIVNYWNGSIQTAISSDYTGNTLRKFAIILRAAGCYVVQYSADLLTCNLIHVASTNTTATLYAGGANRISSLSVNCEVDNLSIGQLGGGWASDAYSGASVPLAITGTDKLWLDALFS